MCTAKGVYRSSLPYSLVLCDRDYELTKRLEAQRFNHGKANTNKDAPEVHRQSGEHIQERESGGADRDGETV